MQNCQKKKKPKKKYDQINNKNVLLSKKKKNEQRINEQVITSWSLGQFDPVPKNTTNKSVVVIILLNDFSTNVMLRLNKPVNAYDLFLV